MNAINRTILLSPYKIKDDFLVIEKKIDEGGQKNHSENRGK